MKKLLTLVSIYLGILIQTASACQYDIEFFCNSIKDKDFVAKGKIIKVAETYTQIKLINNLFGSEEKDTIVVWDGKPVVFCAMDPERMELFPFEASLMGEEGDTIIFAAERIAEAENEWDVVGDYRFIRLPESTVLKLENGILKGYISGDGSIPAPQFWTLEMPEEVFIEKFQECKGEGRIILSNTKNIEDNLLNLYPNPVENLLTIDLGSSSKNYESIVIKNQLGQIVKTVAISGSASAVQVDLSSLESGVFFMELASQRYVSRRKIVKR